MIVSTCENCYHSFRVALSLDKLGFHVICPKCGNSFHIEVPKKRIKMFFMNTESRTSDYFDDYYRGAVLCSYYAFDDVKDFIAKWKEVSKNPDSMWYWCYDGEIEDTNCFCSGACDPDDIEIFREHFFCNEDGIVYPALHERNPKYTYWLYDRSEDRVYHTSEDIAGRELVYQKRRNSLYYDAVTNLPLVPQPDFHVKHLLNRGFHVAKKYISDTV